MGINKKGLDKEYSTNNMFAEKSTLTEKSSNGGFILPGVGVQPK